MAFNYGVVMSDVAKQLDIELTSDLVKKAEKMIEQEFENKTIEQLATDLQVNLLSIFETDSTK